MLSTRSRFRLLPLALVAVIAVMVAIPQLAGATSLLPFSARTSEVGTVVPCDPNFVCVSVTGTGSASRLGKISESAIFTIDPASVPAPGCTTNTGTMTLTSGKGDQIMLTLNGTNCTVDPTHGIALEAYVVTGGTGRYVGATGYGTETVHMDNTNPAAQVIIATFKGTLSAPTSSP